MWYRRAADRGNADAQNILGCIYDEGKGVECNHQSSVEWHQKAGGAHTIAPHVSWSPP